MATSRTLSGKQKDLLRTAFEKIKQKGGSIIISTDRDEAGEEISHELIKIAPKTAQISRHVPDYPKDWNEALKAKIERERQQQNQKRRDKKRFIAVNFSHIRDLVITNQKILIFQWFETLTPWHANGRCTLHANVMNKNTYLSKFKTNCFLGMSNLSLFRIIFVMLLSTQL